VFETTRVRLEVWRAVEAQHVAATMLLVDTQDEQRVLEDLLEASKPPIPPAAAALHYLLFTPFRYPPQGRGSRFRRPHDPGVFYGADRLATACAETGYWRWRFLRDSPSLGRLPPLEQTVFQAKVGGPAIDLRAPPLVRRRRAWTDPDDYGPCQRLAERARAERVALIRYESVRDPDHGGCTAVLTPAAFVRPRPIAVETWYLTVSPERVRWQRGRLAGDGAALEFTY
jgi:hypothetical protein